MKVLSWIATVAIVIILAYSIYYASSNYRTEPKTVDLKTYNEAIKIGVDLKVQGNNEWVNLTVLLMGFLWAIIIAEKAEFTKIKIQSPSEIILFIAANISYILSLWANFLWKNRVVAAYLDINVDRSKVVEVPNILCRHINALSEVQFTFFILGILSTTLLILFARFTKNRSC